jgi:hypothetical protein
MLITIEVLDDSGSMQDLIELEESELEDFESQLPEGWSTEELER